MRSMVGESMRLTFLLIFFFPGYLDDQKRLEAKLMNSTDSAAMNDPELNYVPGLQTEDRFRLNNLSFAGPVIMGTGGHLIRRRIWYRRQHYVLTLFPGFLIVAACVITFETRDNAAKVAPSTSSFHGSSQHGRQGSTRNRSASFRRSARGGSAGMGPDGRGGAIQFRSSSSQTTFLDRNIIETLGVSVVTSGAGAGAALTQGAPQQQQQQQQQQSAAPGTAVDVADGKGAVGAGT